MSDTNDSGAIITRSLDPLDVLDVVARGVKFADPVIGHFAKLCVDLARERRLEIEAHLAARLQEISLLFAKLDETRAGEIADRELQFNALSALLELAKSSGDPQLIAQAMEAFQHYVRSAPALTRDFTEALKTANITLEAE